MPALNLNHWYRNSCTVVEGCLFGTREGCSAHDSDALQRMKIWGRGEAQGTAIRRIFNISNFYLRQGRPFHRQDYHCMMMINTLTKNEHLPT
mmetsp:Transcript_30017/g.51968  ORF Transcript_30017/g.51968 Transcript_30017/m.51968 type:complete len:92 (-) Transcript_30017:356-631(-)